MSARPTFRKAPWSTAWSGTYASRRSSRHRCSTRSQATFEEYWNDPAFEQYDPCRVDDRNRLRTALAAESGGHPADLPIDITSIDVRPYGYQQEILEELDAERTVHGRFQNLVVMATGTGKTVVAALDYRRLRQAGRSRRILFVAHQEQILRQSRAVFRQVLRDGTFGELFVGGERPAEVAARLRVRPVAAPA